MVGNIKFLIKKYYTKERRYRFIIDPEDDFLYFTTLRVKEFLTRSAKKKSFCQQILISVIKTSSIKRKKMDRILNLCGEVNLAVTLDIYMNILIRIIQIIRVSGH